MQKHVNDLRVDTRRSSIYVYLLAKIGVDTAENEPLKVHLIFKLWDSIFTEPSLPLRNRRRLARAVPKETVTIVGRE